MAGDINYNNVSLLLHGDGANGSTVFTDTSSSPKTMTAVGTARISTAVSKFGGASMLFDGASGNLTTPQVAAFNFGSGDFTVEGWIYLTATPAAGNFNTVCSNLIGSASKGWRLIIDSSNKVNAISGFWSAASPTVVTAPTLALALNTFYHVAIVRIGTSIKNYINGVLDSEVSVGATTAILDSTKSTFDIGVNDGGTWYYKGNIDDLRITKGVGRYTANFTPPTAAFSDTGVVVLGEIALAAPHQLLTAFGGATAKLAVPHQSLTAFGGAIAALRAPSPLFFGSVGAHVLFTAPSPHVLATGHDSTGERAFSGIAPRPSLVARSGANSSLRVPRPRLLATGTGTVIGRALLSAPSPALAASGEGGGVGSASLRGPKPSLRGFFGGVLSVTIGRATLQASGSAGSVGQAAVRAPLFELVATATRQNSGSALLVAPSPRLASGAHGFLLAPMARLVAIGSAVVVASYEAYSLNLNHKGFKDPVDELTRYTNFPFTHIVRYQNSYFGVAADGLYLLEGTTDFADPPTAVPWAWKTGTSDFGSPQKKTLVSAYFGGRLGQAATVTQYIGEAGTEQYAYAGVSGPDAQNYRQRFGLGIKTRYQALGVAGTGELALDTIDFNIANLSRRI